MKKKTRRRVDCSITLEHPRGLVDENDAKRLGIIRFEAFDHELEGGVVLRLQSVGRLWE